MAGLLYVMLSLLLPTKSPILRFGVIILLPVVLLVILDHRNSSVLTKAVFPYGLPSKLPSEDRPTCGQVDLSNDSLLAKHGKFTKIVERLDDDGNDSSKPLLLQSPETIMVHPLDGTLYTATIQGYLISLTDLKTTEDEYTFSAHTQIVQDLGPGRPLGGKFTADGTTLYIADAMLGLLRIQNVTSPNSKVEIVVSQVVEELAQPQDTSYSYPDRLGLADDLTIGPQTGKVYFTDASRIQPPRNAKDGTYDVMYASKVDIMIGQPTGRLLEYDPLTDQVRILARHLSFANGVAVDANEEYLVFVETFRLAIAKYYLKGPKEGTIEYIVKGFPSPAYFDGIDCAWKGHTAETSYCYAANPSNVVFANRIVWAMPHPLDYLIRTLLLSLPKEWLPETKPYGGITIVNPITSEYIGLLQDPHGDDIGHITGVTVHDNKLFLGSLENNFIGVYDLS